MDNKWTVALAAAGVVSAACVAVADESHPVNTLLPATTLSGYVDTAAIWNFGSSYNTLGGAVPHNAVVSRFANTGSDRQDGFNVNAVKVALEKPLDEGTWSAGYKVETIFGPDANALPGSLGSAASSVGVALKQAYVALRAPVGNGIDIKVGQFDPIIGYEVYDSYANPNFSRSMGFFLEPISHTGILASYQFNDVLGVAGGIANTHFGNIYQKVNVESDKTYTGSITVKAPESWGWLKGSSLYAGVVAGADVGATTGPRPVNLYLGASMSTPWQALTWGVGYDYLFNPYNSALNTTAKSSYADAFAAYVSYQATEKLKINARGEYATTSGGLLLPLPVNDEKVFGLTITADYSLWANVVTRAEFRWDRDVGAATPGGGPFNGQRNDFSLLANIIYKF
jgi:Putative beta-barrel porin-2, OmpL-like. bbp2